MSQPPPPYAVGEGTINVLIVGESQQGKSTLIKQINNYAGQTDVDIKIGNGNVACTKSVDEYKVGIVPREFQLVNPQGEAISGLDYSQLRRLRSHEARVVEVVEPDGPKVRFNFIDTPGLNDSRGDDLMNMAHIIGRTSELTHLNALVYVRNVEEAYSRSFQQFFSYLQRCLPAFSQGFIIVHSKFTTRKVDQLLAENVDLAGLRREAFQKTMNLHLEHFFMDNEPSSLSPFSRLQSLNEICRFLRHLESQRPMPSIGFRLLKSATMQNVDVHARNSLNELKNSLERERHKEESIGEKFTHDSVFHQLEISRMKTRVATIVAQINDLKHGPDVLLGTKSCVEDYTLGSLFRQGQVYLAERHIEYISDHEITSVTKSSRGSHWKDVSLQGKTWRATLASGAFRGINGTATFYTTSAIKNRELIKVLVTMVKELEEGFVAHEASMMRNGVAEHFNQNAARLGKNLEKVDNILKALASEEFEMALWPRLKGFYMSGGGLSRHQTREFVQVYDKEVADMLPP